MATLLLILVPLLVDTWAMGHLHVAVPVLTLVTLLGALYPNL